MTRPRWAVLALLTTLPLAACGGGSDGEPSTAEGQVETSTTIKAPSVKVAKTYEDLSKALKIAAPEGYLLQPDQVGDTGPSDIVKASRDDGGNDAQEFLARTGFLRGYQRMWSRSADDDFVVYLYQFGDNAGAVEYTNRLMTEATTGSSGVTIERFDVPGIGGAMGVNASDPTFATSSVTFVKGPYSVQIEVNGETLTGLQSLATALAEEQYSRL
ncbi:MAG: hypothetical protein ACRDYF_02760 [Acidimicrobiia bacterium]